MELFFDIPWWLPVGILAAGIGVFIHGNNRLNKKQKLLGLGIMSAAVVLTMISYLVETDREIITRQTRALAQAVVEQNRQKMGLLLDRDVTAHFWGKQEILDGAVHYAQLTRLKSATVFSLQVTPEGRRFISRMTVWSRHDPGGMMMHSELNSQWQLLWDKTNEGWLVLEIIPLQIGPVQREAIEQRYLTQPVIPTR